MERPRFQLIDYLYAAAEIAPHLPCFLFPDGSSQSFAQTEQRVTRLANAMGARGIGRGDRAVLMSLDRHEYVETMYACTMIGAVFVPLAYRLRENELATLLRAAGPRALFVGKEHAEIAGKLSVDLAGLALRVGFDGDADMEDYETFLASGEAVRASVKVEDDDCVAIVFTSGTTGMPKGVMQSQRALKTMISHSMINFETPYEGCGYSGSPLYHIAGYGFAFTNLISRSACFFLPQFNPALVLEYMGKGNITHCVLVPTMITMLLDHPDCPGTDFSSLKVVMYGAAPISPGLLRRAMDRFGCDFVQLFGAATETGTQLVLTSRDHRRAAAGEEHLLGSVGRPGLSVRMRIVDAEGNDLPDGEVGEIITRSDQSMIGYLGMPEETGQAIRDGWFWAGDLGYRDAQGYVYLAGRRKDMIIRGGVNIYPVEIETVMAGVPGIVMGAVIGEPDEHWGETVLACLVVDDNFVGVARMIEICASKLARYKVPSRVEILASMPMTGSGKISKPELRSAGREGRAALYGARA